jgi:hypothetical protein
VLHSFIVHSTFSGLSLEPRRHAVCGTLALTVLLSLSFLPFKRPDRTSNLQEHAQERKRGTAVNAADDCATAKVKDSLLIALRSKGQEICRASGGNISGESPARPGIQSGEHNAERYGSGRDDGRQGSTCCLMQSTSGRWHVNEGR